MFAFLFLSVSVKDKMVSRLLSWLPGLNRYAIDNVGIFMGLNILVNIELHVAIRKNDNPLVFFINLHDYFFRPTDGQPSINCW